MSTLTDRYVHATTRAVPEPQRDEIARELRSEIEEMIAARTDAGEPHRTAERETLQGLGDPERLAASYVDRPLVLIGPAYFLVWKRLLVTLLLWVPATVGVVIATIELIDEEQLGPAIGAGAGTAVEVAVQVAFWVTFTFALVDRYSKPSDAPQWKLDELPELPVKTDVGLAETAGSIATGVVTLALLIWQELRGVIETSSGERVPLIDSGLWSSWLPLLVALLVADMVFAALAYRRRRWTWPLVAGVSVADVAFAAPLIWLLLDDRLLDPRFVAEVDWLGEADHLHVVGIAVAVSIALIVAGDIVGKVRAARASSEPSAKARAAKAA